MQISHKEKPKLTFIRIKSGAFWTGTTKSGTAKEIGNTIEDFVCEKLRVRNTEYQGDTATEVQAFEADGKHVLTLTSLNALKFLQHVQKGKPITLEVWPWQHPETGVTHSVLKITSATKREQFQILDGRDGRPDWEATIIDYLETDASDLQRLTSLQPEEAPVALPAPDIARDDEGFDDVGKIYLDEDGNELGFEGGGPGPEDLEDDETPAAEEEDNPSLLSV